MKKILLTEAEKNKIISEREKLIIQNFANTFNKIKRIDESEVDEKVIEEGLKANLAAAALAAAGAHGAQAQTNQPSLPNAHGKEIQASPNKQSLAGAANPYGAEDKSNVFAHTKPIVDIQYGVQDGKTGQPAIYVYHKDRNAPGFNPATDRTTVFTKYIDLLQKTRQYQDYMRSKSGKNNSGVAGGIDERIGADPNEKNVEINSVDEINRIFNDLTEQGYNFTLEFRSAPHYPTVSGFDEQGILLDYRSGTKNFSWENVMDGEFEVLASNENGSPNYRFNFKLDSQNSNE